jgi:hypothetical protein
LVTPSWMTTAVAEDPEKTASSHFTSPERRHPAPGHEAGSGVSCVGAPGAVTGAGSGAPSSRTRRREGPVDDRCLTGIGLRTSGGGQGPPPYQYVLGSRGARPGFVTA